MRLAAIALIVGVAAGGAIAQTSQPSTTEPTLAEIWVGTWTGAVKWKECSLETGDKLALPIAALGGVLTTDGDLLYEGLGAVVWSASGKQLVVSREGVELSLTPGKKGAVKLKMTTQSGCTATASLKRATSGIPSCDAVRALAAVKSTCDGLAEDTRDDDLADVDGKWKGWKKLKGKKKKAQAKVCAARLPTLRGEVASCSPAGGGTIVAGTACQKMIALYRNLGSCTGLPEETRKQITDMLPMMEQQIASMGEEMCQQTFDAMQSALPSLGCTP